jgi:nuclear cap-binding protein subunit 1
MKIPFIATTVLTANTIKSELVADVLKRTAERLHHNVNAGAWREVKLLLRFLGCLQCIFEGDGVFTILEELFSRAVDLQTASSEDVGSSEKIIIQKVLADKPGGGGDS